MSIKKTRARSLQKKEKQFEVIIEEGKKLFTKNGHHDFSMRALARNLDMSEAFLYTYVESKRELWFAIRTKYLKEYFNEVKKVIKNHQGSVVELAVEFAEFFFEFASKDSKRFQMIWSIPPPHSKKIGPIEKAFKPFHIMELAFRAIKNAFKVGGLNQEQVTEYLYFMFAISYGSVCVESFLKIKEKIPEPFKIESDVVSVHKFRDFVLKEIRRIAESRFR